MLVGCNAEQSPKPDGDIKGMVIHAQECNELRVAQNSDGLYILQIYSCYPGWQLLSGNEYKSIEEARKTKQFLDSAKNGPKEIK